MPETGPFSINALSESTGHDRRALKRWLIDFEPAGFEAGNPLYTAEDAEAAITKAQRSGRRTSAAKERLLALQADKLAFQLDVLKKRYVERDEVEAEVGQMIQQAKTVLLRLPMALAPQVVGVSIPEAEQLVNLRAKPASSLRVKITHL